MAKPDDFAEGPDPIDRHVGLRLRLRRRELGVSQEKLAETIGLTFQQIQKYERAANRISASKLWAIAQALNTTVGFFYEGIGERPIADRPEPTSAEPTSAEAREFLMTAEGRELAASFPRIPQSLRGKLIELVRIMIEAPSTEN
jgi:transcriptional regulator with XRE-family HTH domain